MSEIDSELQSHLNTGTTTICTCWIVKRRNGEKSGYTDHDNDLQIEGVLCQASSGFKATEAAQLSGLSVDNQEIEGAIVADTLSDDDLRTGRLDNAEVEIWQVNWQAPKQRHHLRTAILGEVSRHDNVFRAELRGLTSVLDRRLGRVFKRSCDAIVGDGRCKIDLSRSEYRLESTVSEVINQEQIYVEQVENYPLDWFAGGNLTWTSGANAGLTNQISNTPTGNPGQLLLWETPAFEVEPGDALSITVGCNKAFSTCKSKFGNELNFQGFPHIPGGDFALGYANRGTIHDGSALVK